MFIKCEKKSQIIPNIKKHFVTYYNFYIMNIFIFQKGFAYKC